MFSLNRKLINLGFSYANFTLRSISTTNVAFVKEIKIKEDDRQITVEAVPIESDRKDYLVNLPEDSFKAVGEHKCTSCPLCRLNLKRLSFSDVLILNQFIKSNGVLMYQKDTGLCNRSYRQVKRLVQQAQSARLLPRPPDYESYGPWDELNHYYEYPKRIRDQPKSIIRKEYW